MIIVQFTCKQANNSDLVGKKDRQTDKQIYRQRDRQRYRQRDRQRDR